MENEKLKQDSDLWIMLITNTSAVLNQDLHKGIQLRTNINAFPQIGAHTYHAIAIFGIYYVQQKLSSSMGTEQDRQLEQMMRQDYLDFISKFVLKVKMESKDMQSIIAFYDNYFDKLKKGVGSPANALKDVLISSFNDHTKIQFVNESPIKQVKFGLGMLFSNKDSSKNYYESEKILDESVKNIAAHFLQLELPK